MTARQGTSSELINTLQLTNAKLTAQLESQQQDFDTHLAEERKRFENLEQDTVELKKLLQDLQPEFHQLQADLEKSNFEIKQHQAEASLFEEERKIRQKQDEERAAIEVENANLRKSRDELKAQL